jgi:hypothetical protein
VSVEGRVAWEMSKKPMHDPLDVEGRQRRGVFFGCLGDTFQLEGQGKIFKEGSELQLLSLIKEKNICQTPQIC